MRVAPITESFAARILDSDLTVPLAPSDRSLLQDAIDSFGVLAIPGQRLDDESQVAFSRIFGELEAPLEFDQYAGVHKLVTRLANVGEGNRLMAPDERHAIYMKGNQLWHTDSSYKPVPSKYSILSAREIPSEGGETEFADCRAAYDDWDLSADGFTRDQIDPLVCEHSIVYSRSLIVGDIFTEQEKASLPPVRQPLVRTHPATGRRNFYAGAHASHVIGWPLEQGRRLIGEINEFCTRPRYVYTHEWSTNDLVIWDNRRVLHRGRPHDPGLRRVMHRTTIRGDGGDYSDRTS